MSKPKYDFREAASFLDDSCPLSVLCENVFYAMHILSDPNCYITKKKRAEIWSTLLTCADFLDTIALK